jgi:hypothetical protein
VSSTVSTASFSLAPAMYHLVNYFNGVGLDQQARIFTGS